MTDITLTEKDIIESFNGGVRAISEVVAKYPDPCEVDSLPLFRQMREQVRNYLTTKMINPEYIDYWTEVFFRIAVLGFIIPSVTRYDNTWKDRLLELIAERFSNMEVSIESDTAHKETN